jgi:hypothetical protein
MSQLSPNDITRNLQKECKALPRSVRKFIPLISARIGHSSGIIAHNLDGFGSNQDTMKAILSAARAVLENPPDTSHTKLRRKARI